MRQSLRNLLLRVQLEMNPSPLALPLIVSDNPLAWVQSIASQELFNVVVLLAQGLD